MTQSVTMPAIGTAAAWRAAARDFLIAGVPPEDIIWGDTTSERDLFANDGTAPTSRGATVSRAFINMANTVVWHSDPERFARLYAFLWRLRSSPQLMQDRGVTGLSKLRAMEKQVHRCQHKMKAFIRFRELGSPDDARRSFAAWFEPTHHTVEPTAAFFARRFGDMDWRILTPDVSAHFVDGDLSFTAGQDKPELPADASEELWITYFRNIFNPARLKVRAMQSEMPKKYWKNMPEATAIPGMIAQAPARARQMADAAPTQAPAHFKQAQAQLAGFQSTWRRPVRNLQAEISSCTRCPLHRHATQAVAGQGPLHARLMIVGEQPGDMEDLAGRPFVGPSGELLDQIAAEVGLDRERAFVTNAVKHFKFRPRGKRRIHQRPNAGEVSHCKWWLEAELATVKPELVISMGATAAKALTGRGDDLMARRGRVEISESGIPVLLTIHPSYILRQTSATARTKAEAVFRRDLKLAVGLLSDPRALRFGTHPSIPSETEFKLSISLDFSAFDILIRQIQ